MHNQSVEDYIKSIYKLRKKGKTVSTSELATHLDVKDGSVTDMIKRLSLKGLLRYTPYQGVKLTKEGERLAVTLMRRHRLWEMFLVKFLSYTWDEVHDEAEKFEHVISDEMERRLDKALGYPKVDPHGDPIPTAQGKLEAQANTSLGEFNAGDKVRILRVSDRDPEVLQHASKLGLVLHAKVIVKEKMQFDGSMIVKVKNKQRFISRHVANSIFVQAV